MIIRNNFNDKSVNPLKDYESVSKTRNNNIDGENINFNNPDKDIIDDIIRHDHEFEDDDEEIRDNWDFFK